MMMRVKDGIAVAGAHGKTTTTSMIALMLERAGTDPTVIIGGELNDIGGNAKLGEGRFLVAEADESDGSFLRLSPHIEVVTNIEDDHMDYYKSMDNIPSAFRQFVTKLPKDGLAVLCFNNANVRDMAKDLKVPCVSYAVDAPADYYAQNIRMSGVVTCYDAYFQGERLTSISLNVPGVHNVLNSLAAVAVGHHLGLSADEISFGLEAFSGVKRRFQTKARSHGIWVVDDYAHHPTEINTTLLAARQTKPQRLICAFQPHRYTRTQLLHKEFGKAFEQADLLLLTDIYSAGERPIPGVSSELIRNAVEKNGNPEVVYIPNKNELVDYMLNILRPGDLVITMGAGDIVGIGEELAVRLADDEAITAKR